MKSMLKMALCLILALSLFASGAVPASAEEGNSEEQMTILDDGTITAAVEELLASYGDLNSSKMKIISYIERQLPASLYDAEWAALSDKLNKRKYVSFTNSEKKVPLLFIIVYACVSICSVAFLF